MIFMEFFCYASEMGVLCHELCNPSIWWPSQTLYCAKKDVTCLQLYICEIVLNLPRRFLNRNFFFLQNLAATLEILFRFATSSRAVYSWSAKIEQLLQLMISKAFDVPVGRKDMPPHSTFNNSIVQNVCFYVLKVSIFRYPDNFDSFEYPGGSSHPDVIISKTDTVLNFHSTNRLSRSLVSHEFTFTSRLKSPCKLFQH